MKNPPYAVSEHGYGSFFLPIEVYFKNKIEPRKLQFDYDLILPAFGSLPIDNIRSEALTFTNPTDEFKRKLVKGGGIVTKTTTTNGFHRYCKLGCFGFILLVQAVLYLFESAWDRKVKKHFPSMAFLKRRDSRKTRVSGVNHIVHEVLH